MRSVLLATCLLLLPGTAQAATVTLRVNPDSGDRYSVTTSTAVFTAASGEVNDLQVIEGPGAIRFADVVPLQAGDGCTAVDERTVECRYALWPEVWLGDGDDRARCDDVCYLHGEAGEDALEADEGGELHAHGGEGADVLRGGSRNDELSGGPGADVLEGGADNDTLVGDDPARPYSADRLDGGEGSADSVSYAERRTPVRVALGSPGSGADGDVLTAVEDVIGGRGADLLAGDDGPNRLVGGGGKDRLTGAGGHDVLEGSSAAETLEGGAGDDVLEGQGGRDRYRAGPGDDTLRVSWSEYIRHYAQAELSCGGGDDLVVGPSPSDTVRRACETVELNLLRFRRLPGGLAFRFRPADQLYDCPARLVAISGAHRVARRFRTNTPATLRFPGFTAADVRLRRRGCGRPGERLAGGFRAPR